MGQLFIDALGVCTPLGATAMTMGYVHTSATKLSSLRVADPFGDPLVGLTTELVSTGSERLLELAATALAGCPVPERALPLLLCVPPGQAGFQDVRAFARSLERAARMPFESALSSFYEGEGEWQGATLASALLGAHDLLRERRANSCWVGGVDSLVDDRRLLALMNEDRPRYPGHPEGLLPSEGAVFLRVSREPSPGSLAVVRGIGQAAHSPHQQDGLSRALAEALRVSECRASDIGLVVDVAPPDGDFATERALALTRHAPASDTATRLLPISVGHLGAASSAMGLAYLAFFVAQASAPPRGINELALGGRRKLLAGGLHRGRDHQEGAGALVIQLHSSHTELRFWRTSLKALSNLGDQHRLDHEPSRLIEQAFPYVHGFRWNAELGRRLLPEMVGACREDEELFGLGFACAVLEIALPPAATAALTPAERQSLAEGQRFAMAVLGVMQNGEGPS